MFPAQARSDLVFASRSDIHLDLGEFRGLEIGISSVGSHTGLPMDLDITRQDSYSRGELLLRTSFGSLYITAPHTVILLFIGIWANIVHFVAWWVILFTGRYPEQFFEFNVKLLSWQMRLNASMHNLIDGYPAIGLSGSHPAVHLRVDQPEHLSRGKLLLRTFLGLFYVSIPHGFCLQFRYIATSFLHVLSFWSILFTGSIPENWFEFNVGTLRWVARLNLYMLNMTDEYPPFSGKPIST